MSTSINPKAAASFSTIIVNYNAGPLLALAVQSILDQATEVIVVDNVSSDGSVEHLVERFSGNDKLRIIRNGKNLGFATACNIGFRASTCPTVLFLNPDCIPEEEAISGLINVLHSDSTIGMVGGLQINPDGSEQGGSRRAVPTPWRSFVRAFGLHRWADRWPKLFFDFHLHRSPLPASPIEIEAISGACMLVKRTAMEAVGLWDSGYFLHCEDLDLCMRFRQKNWKIMFVPDSRIYHELGVCGRGRKLFVEWHKHKGMVRFYRKFFRHQYPLGLMWLVSAGVWLRFSMICISHLVVRKSAQS